MKRILTLLLILLLIAGCSNSKYVYNGYTITKHEFGWAATVYAGQREQPYIVYLHYGPKEVDKINSETVKDKILNSHID